MEDHLCLSRNSKLNYYPSVFTGECVGREKTGLIRNQ